MSAAYVNDGVNTKRGVESLCFLDRAICVSAIAKQDISEAFPAITERDPRRFVMERSSLVTMSAIDFRASSLK